VSAFETAALTPTGAVFLFFQIFETGTFFKFLESVVTWDIQYSLPGEAPGSGNILRVRRFRIGRPIAISPTDNVPLATSPPASLSSSVAVSPLDAPIATARHTIAGQCRRVPARIMVRDGRLPIFAHGSRSRLRKRRKCHQLVIVQASPKRPTNRFQSARKPMANGVQTHGPMTIIDPVTITAPRSGTGRTSGSPRRGKRHIQSSDDSVVQ